MDWLYILIGKFIVWGGILGLVGIIAFIILGFIWYRIIWPFFDSDWFMFHFGKRTFETGFIRTAYQSGKLNKKGIRICLKYRLRNIRRANK